MKHTLFPGAWIKVKCLNGLFRIESLHGEYVVVCEVVRHHKIQPHYRSVLYHDLLPIPLDSGVLGSSGFKQKQTNYFKQKSMLVHTDPIFGVRIVVKGKVDFTPIPSFHQLQYLGHLYSLDLKLPHNYDC